MQMILCGENVQVQMTSEIALNNEYKQAVIYQVINTMRVEALSYVFAT